MGEVSLGELLRSPRLLLSSWPWRSLYYLLGSCVVGAVTLPALLVLTGAGVLTLSFLIGVPLLLLVPMFARGLARLERRRLAVIDPAPLPTVRAARHSPGAWGWLSGLLRDGSTWRDVGYMVLFAFVLAPFDAVVLWVLVVGPLPMVAAPLYAPSGAPVGPTALLDLWWLARYADGWLVSLLGLVLLLVAGYLLTVLAVVRVRLARVLLTHQPEPILAKTAWQAMTRQRFLLSAWPWRSAVYLLSSAAVALVVGVLQAGLLVVGGIGSVVLIGLPLLALSLLAGVPVASVERWRLRLVDTGPAADPHREPDGPGMWSWLLTRYGEAVTWRELGYTVLFVVVLAPLDLLVSMLLLIIPVALLSAPLVLMFTQEPVAIAFWEISTLPESLFAVPVGLVLLAVSGYLLTAVAGSRGALARLMLAPHEEQLGAQLVEVERSRARLVDAFEVERRRIERDLHDGAQQRLVSLAMSLGLAKLDLPPGSEAAEQVASAHEQAKLALAELRELIRGIHPQVLTDRGLPAAVADVADRSPVAVTVDMELPHRLPGEVEAAAYFMVSEALSNVAKHSGARRAIVAGRFADGSLIVEVTDDGRGGADPSLGTGITGLADRVAVLDGTLKWSSPPGGPTVLRVEIPCAQSSLTDRQPVAE
ncbi:sensor domain-containing protein [Allonocardiopsis opalescens]|uniref:sensor domain-containing protein n=1 Tax=Allonocardiopsis opalescens TaxID=1144618 RepID=UPI0011B20509